MILMMTKRAGKPTYVKHKRLGLLGHNQLLLAFRVETVFSGQITHDRQVLGHLDRLAIVLIDYVGQVRIEQAWN